MLPKATTRAARDRSIASRLFKIGSRKGEDVPAANEVSKEGVAYLLRSKRSRDSKGFSCCFRVYEGNSGNPH